MAADQSPYPKEFNTPFKLFHELMAWKVTEILLVSTPYDAWVLEEDCRLSERVISEYQGLNLSRPPRLTWVPSAQEALNQLEQRRFDMVLTMSYLSDMAPEELGSKIKTKAPDLPVILLTHQTIPGREDSVPPTISESIDDAFVWSGDTDIVVALIKSTEDRVNVHKDTHLAGIRVILLAQDHPHRLSHVLPILYREVVCQTQALMQRGLNEEERLLTMRARPKILVARTYEDALVLFKRFEPYVLGVIADAELDRSNTSANGAGVDLLAYVRKERFDIPLLMTSSRKSDAARAKKLDAVCLENGSPFYRDEIQAFFKQHLGFGDFIFRSADGEEVGRADSLLSLAEGILKLSPEIYEYHSRRNDFSRWLFARSETVLASRMRPLSFEDFPDVESQRHYLVEMIRARHRQRSSGVVADFDVGEFDLQTEFVKLGNGSLGGKARGLAFLGHLLGRDDQLEKIAAGVTVFVPQTLVITTDYFDGFIADNGLGMVAQSKVSDDDIARRFLSARLPEDLVAALNSYLERIHYPLAVRSSGLLEDAQQHAYAGLYHTYLLPNDHSDPKQCLDHLLQAIKLVYASTYFQDARAYAQRVGHRTSDEKMAVMVQHLVGSAYESHFYPSISGVAQSFNYYPQAAMQPEDGVAVIALGLGKSVVSGEQSLRFSPKYPKSVPQRTCVEDVLAYAQRHFYALRLGSHPALGVDDSVTLKRRDVSGASEELPLKLLSSTYQSEDHRIRDTTGIPGQRVLTFAAVLKHDMLPVAPILQHILKTGEAGMGRPVEVEFAVDLPADVNTPARFALLQLRPMSARATSAVVDIAAQEIDASLCYAQQAMGNSHDRTLADIIYIKPDRFDAARTREMAREVAELNAHLVKSERKYLLVGPGRWGSQDPWLGIPVKWADIDGVGAIVETTTDALTAELSQGAHFFHNLTSLDISYLCVTDRPPDHFDWDWLTGQPIHRQTQMVAHVELDAPLDLKVDGRSSQGVIGVTR
jgi:hypothetical protein